MLSVAPIDTADPALRALLGEAKFFSITSGPIPEVFRTPSTGVDSRSPRSSPPGSGRTMILYVYIYKAPAQSARAV